MIIPPAIIVASRERNRKTVIERYCVRFSVGLGEW